VPYTDNFFASLNSAVFSDGTFCYVPPGVRCPVELMTYFRINAENTGQFERTLIIADKGSYVSYLEGCTAPMRKTSQLHAAVVNDINDIEIGITPEPAPDKKAKYIYNLNKTRQGQ
jgi:Fe-S cluster assembly protein SufB